MNCIRKILIINSIAFICLVVSYSFGVFESTKPQGYSSTGTRMWYVPAVPQRSVPVAVQRDIYQSPEDVDLAYDTQRRVTDWQHQRSSRTQVGTTQPYRGSAAVNPIGTTPETMPISPK